MFRSRRADMRILPHRIIDNEFFPWSHLKSLLVCTFINRDHPVNEKQSCYELQMINVRYVSGLSIVGQNSEPVPFVCDLITVTPTADGTELIQKLFVSLLLLLIQPHRTTKRLSWLKVQITAAQRFSPWWLHPSQLLHYSSCSYYCFEPAWKNQLFLLPSKPDLCCRSPNPSSFHNRGEGES